MSMFYELMMRKKEEIMYATIKGTLTENDGVFSGFSSSNYLQLQQFVDYNSVSSWEIGLTFTTGNDVSSTQGIYHDSWTIGGIYISIISSRIRPYFSFGNDEYVFGYPSTTIQTNTKYYFKLKFTGTQYLILLSTDNMNWTEYYSLTDSRKVANQTTSLGILGYSNRFSNQQFLGSIDLNNSYIKLGSTKYNLQAVVGWTKVGRPTITDGVVSGFSSADYLKVSPFIISATDIIEEKISFTIDTISGNQWILSRSQNNVLLGAYVNSSGKLRIPFVENSGSAVNCSLDYVLSANTYYSVTIVRKADGTLISTLYNNQGTVLETNSTTAQYAFTGTADMFIGVTASGGHGLVFNGSIDMNNTFIKINNKLWFNGQEG